MKPRGFLEAGAETVSLHLRRLTFLGQRAAAYFEYSAHGPY